VTSIYRLLGDPVEHSVSPALYTAAFDILGVDAAYESKRVVDADLGAAMLDAASRGGGNVTLPHKLRAAAALDTPSPAVLRSGACNCFWPDRSGSLAGDNTDVDGFLSAARRFAEQAGSRLRGASCLLLGAGGAARGVLVALAEARAKSVDVLNRNQERAARMLAEIHADGLELRLLGDVREASRGYDLVVNATSLGLHAADPLPIDLSGLEARAAFDCVYALGGTDWTRHAEREGIPAVDGLGMLVEQARGSLRNWLDVDIDTVPLERAAVAALATSLPGR
jgi:shikimate dehydrogenase